MALEVYLIKLRWLALDICREELHKCNMLSPKSSMSKMILTELNPYLHTATDVCHPVITRESSKTRNWIRLLRILKRRHTCLEPLNLPGLVWLTPSTLDFSQLNKRTWLTQMIISISSLPSTLSILQESITLNLLMQLTYRSSWTQISFPNFKLKMYRLAQKESKSKRL